jgi:transcriptional regulator with XRE-family HTH domain
MLRDLGAEIRMRRERRGWTQDDLAELCGVTRATISNAERGVRMPRNMMLAQLLTVIGIDMRELLARWQTRARDEREAG